MFTITHCDQLRVARISHEQENEIVPDISSFVQRHNRQINLQVQWDLSIKLYNFAPAVRLLLRFTLALRIYNISSSDASHLTVNPHKYEVT